MVEFYGKEKCGMKNKDRYETLEEMYIDNYKLVFTYIKDYTEDPDLMEELASTIWLKVWERVEVFLVMDKKGVKYYLRAMVKTTVSDYFRHLHKENTMIEKVIDLYEPFDWNSEEDKLFKEDMLYYLKKSILSLTEKEQLLITMRFIHNKSARETGDILGIKEGAVRVRQLRILVKMRNEIKKLMDEGRETDEKENAAR